MRTRKAGKQYATVAASQTAQALSSTGATGDYLSHLIINITSTSPGSVAVKDGSDTAITVFTGGVGSVVELGTRVILIDANSRTGGWQVTTGANMSVIAVGQFS